MPFIGWPGLKRYNLNASYMIKKSQIFLSYLKKKLLISNM